MFKPLPIQSNKLRRVGVTPRSARRHADAADGPQPIVSRPKTPVTKQGSSRRLVHSPEQPVEPSTRSKRSHPQERVHVVTDNSSSYSSSITPKLFVGIDVSMDCLDIARSDDTPVWRRANDAAGIE